MPLAALALALFAPMVAPVQLQPGPLQGPNGGDLEIHDIELVGTAHWLLATEFSSSGERTVVARIDGTGSVAWTPPLPSELTASALGRPRLLAVGENRILVKDLTRTYRTYALGPQGWQAEWTLTPSMHGGTFRDVYGDISGSTVTLSMPLFFSEPIVIDGATGAALGSLPATPGARIEEIAIDGDTAVLLEVEIVTLPSGDIVNGPTHVPVFRRVAGTWSRAGEVQNPTGFGWRGSLKVAFEGSTIAVSAQKVSPTDPCPKLILFEEDPSGAFVPSAEFEAAFPCAMSSTVGVGYDDLRLLGSELAAIEGLDDRADRFERTPTGWVRRERVAAETRLSAAWPVSGQIVGSYAGFIDHTPATVFAPVSTPGLTAIGCATHAPILSRFEPFARTQTTVGPITLGWFVEAADPGRPYLFAVGFESGSRQLGPMAELCIGGTVTVLPPTFRQSFSGRDFVELTLDPVAAGLLPGGTLYVQGWRPQPMVPGGLTSNSLSILFAP